MAGPMRQGSWCPTWAWRRVPVKRAAFNTHLCWPLGYDAVCTRPHCRLAGCSRRHGGQKPCMLAGDR